MAIKKLIEVALPLEKINEASAREKSIRHGHPSTFHLWWARRPLAAARAVVWSSLVDDPSSHPELFPTEEDQNKERQRLFKILEDLVVWENSNNPKVLDAAKAEIMRWTNNNPPELLDPFAGGGAIPLEAQRLGLVSHAHDLNPVAVMINKAAIEIAPKFSNRPPINKETSENGLVNWVGTAGFAADVKHYGNLLKKKVFEKVGHLYPKVSISNSNNAERVSVIAWIWARKNKCPNPLCACDVPLISSYAISKKKGKEAWVEPLYENGTYRFKVHQGICPNEFELGTKFRSSSGKGKKGTFICPQCKSGVVTHDYIEEEANKYGLQSMPIAIIAEGDSGRLCLEIDKESMAKQMSEVDLFYESEQIEDDVPMEQTRGTFASNAQGGIYGFWKFKDYFTKRQLCSIVTFIRTLDEIQKIVEEDALAAGLSADKSNLEKNGTGAYAYSQAIRVYLSFLIDQITNQSASICGWNSTNTQMRCVFARQAIPMVWDYAECNIFSNSSGSFNNLLELMIKSFSGLPMGGVGFANQADAQSPYGMSNIMISTDPPYYDNIDYSDLSDYFYVWLKKSLKNVYPSLFRTLLVPKAEELIATPYRFEGDSEKAKKFFEDGMLVACKQMYNSVSDDIPLTVYFAYKQSESDNEDESSMIASSGWETMLVSVVKSGFSITGTWPIRTEKPGRSVGVGANALASSIVLVCRKRPENAPTTTRRNFIQELKRELKSSLQKLQSSNIAPVDMAQSAIGPGIGVFSKYTQVLEADGTPMSVRSALQIINQELDLYFNEQDGELDSNSRFCVDFYTQYGFNEAKFGEADTLARAKNTSVATLQSKGVFVAEKGVAHLIDRDKLPEKIDNSDNTVWLFTQRLTRAMSTGGIKACATLIHNVHTSLPEQAKALAYRLHSIAERKGWQDEAFAYNSLVIAWTDIQMAAANIHESEDDQYKLDL